ncbi:hypothetical protein Cflav_PD2734 [Pedosphaera parvula Ellin514]|uniref:Uncharacterized protein n=1 Tax=Pedosphaera parvula (strain Ellin514) TaxID=320771 RepID=B9XJQ4_PEDPL|nr:hypothetical protein Cflav_PD2734 [Pedosphaera parvula Ellin514]
MRFMVFKTLIGFCIAACLWVLIGMPYFQAYQRRKQLKLKKQAESKACREVL